LSPKRTTVFVFTHFEAYEILQSERLHIGNLNYNTLNQDLRSVTKEL